MTSERFTLYLVTCRANGKQYVGQTRRTVEKRWRVHVYAEVQRTFTPERRSEIAHKIWATRRLRGT